jgi:outer membrane receptor protein involved in Fe transport
MSFFAKDILLDGGTYTGIDGEFVGTDSKNRELFRTEFSDELPSRFLFDFNAGYNFSIGKQMPVRGTISLQVLNLFDIDYLASADRYGVIPGMKRAFRMNLAIGL